MKKILSLLLALTMVFGLCACGKHELSPAEKLDSYITENGTESNGVYTLECPDAVTLIENNADTIASMKNLKGAPKVEFKIIKNETGITLELLDSFIASGLKMERLITVTLDGIFAYSNGLVMNGNELGVYLEGEIPVEVYDKETDPVITKSQLGTGSNLTDDVKNLMKTYINLALDCFANELAKEGLNLTLADFGYVAYPVVTEE